MYAVGRNHIPHHHALRPDACSAHIGVLCLFLYVMFIYWAIRIAAARDQICTRDVYFSNRKYFFNVDSFDLSFGFQKSQLLFLSAKNDKPG